MNPLCEIQSVVTSYPWRVHLLSRAISNSKLGFRIGSKVVVERISLADTTDKICELQLQLAEDKAVIARPSIVSLDHKDDLFTDRVFVFGDWRSSEAPQTLDLMAAEPAEKVGTAYLQSKSERVCVYEIQLPASSNLPEKLEGVKAQVNERVEFAIGEITIPIAKE